MNDDLKVSDVLVLAFAEREVGRQAIEEAERLAKQAADARAATVEQYRKAIDAAFAALERVAEMREIYPAEADVLAATWRAQELDADARMLEAMAGAPAGGGPR